MAVPRETSGLKVGISVDYHYTLFPIITACYLR